MHNNKCRSPCPYFPSSNAQWVRSGFIQSSRKNHQSCFVCCSHVMMQHTTRRTSIMPKNKQIKRASLCVCVVWPSLCVAHPADQIQGWTRWWFFASGGLSLSSTKPRFSFAKNFYVFPSPLWYAMSSQSSPLCPCPVFFRCLISLLIFHPVQ